MSLTALFHPSSVCLVGASGDPRRLAGRPLQRLAHHRYPGAVYLVNPKYSELQGYPCFPSVAAIGQAIDVALVTLPAPLVPAAVRDCGAAGIKYAVVVSSGFEDSTDDLGRRLRDAAEESHVRLVGPNCEGLWSVPARLALTFGSAAARDTMIEGTVSVISQSGSIGGACMRRLQDAGIGCRYFVSTGNESDLTTLDYLDYMVEEGGSTVIALFVEALTDGWRLREIADRAHRQGIRLVALRAGGSRLGREATASHTGRIASSARVYRDVLRQVGVLEVPTLADLLKAVEIGLRIPVPDLAAGPAQPECPQSGVGVIAISGGSRALIADACERRSVPLAAFSPQTRAQLDAVLPEFGYGANPTDVTGAVLDDPGLFAKVLQVVAADEATDALLVQYANGAGAQVDQHLKLFETVSGDGRLPIVMSFLGEPELRAQSGLGAGLILAADPDDAVKYLGWYYHFRRQVAGAAGTPVPPSLPASRDTRPPDLHTWSDRMDFLANLGIATPRWGVCTEASTADDLDYPLVVKALPESVEHKTELGLVIVDVRTRAERAEAIRSIRDRVGGEVPVLVQELVPDAVEVLLTVRHDPDFGPMLAIGYGGVLTEWTDDVVYLQVGATAGQIESALRQLKCWRLLQGYRGRPAGDVDALVAAALRLSRAYAGYSTAGWEIEINPLMVRPKGLGISAVDVLCVRSGPTGGG